VKVTSWFQNQTLAQLLKPIFFQFLTSKTQKIDVGFITFNYKTRTFEAVASLINKAIFPQCFAFCLKDIENFSSRNVWHE
jgi:hypothetical protein